MDFRSDLALEAAENVPSLSDTDCYHTQKTEGDITVTRLEIRSDLAAQKIGKPIGTYITLEFPPLTDDEKKLGTAADLVSREMLSFLPKEGGVLSVGLGNRAITPDALGPRAADMILATRHIQGEFAKSRLNWTSV